MSSNVLVVLSLLLLCPTTVIFRPRECVLSDELTKSQARHYKLLHTRSDNLLVGADLLALQLTDDPFRGEYLLGIPWVRIANKSLAALHLVDHSSALASVPHET